MYLLIFKSLENNKIPVEGFWDQNDERFFAILTEPCVEDIAELDDKESNEDEDEENNYDDILLGKKKSSKKELITFFFSA